MEITSLERDDDQHHDDQLRARAAAAGRVAEADVAAATGVAAGFDAVAASLDHLTALGVAAVAGDAAAVLGVFARAVATAEVDVADLDAVPGAAARAGSLAEGLAEILQRGGGDRVVALAVDLAAGLGLLELQRAAGHDADVRGRRGSLVRLRGSRNGAGGEGTPARTFQHGTRHNGTPLGAGERELLPTRPEGIAHPTSDRNARPLG